MELYLFTLLLATSLLLGACHALDDSDTLFYKDGDNCVPMARNQCYPCTSDSGSTFYLMCSSVQCSGVSSAEACGPSNVPIAVPQRPCAGLSQCNIGYLPAQILQLEAISQDSSAFDDDDEETMRVAQLSSNAYFEAMVNSTYAAVVGDLTQVTLDTLNGNIRFIGLDDDDQSTYRTNNGVCQVGQWCNGVQFFQYRLTVLPSPPNGNTLPEPTSLVTVTYAGRVSARIEGVDLSPLASNLNGDIVLDQADLFVLELFLLSPTTIRPYVQLRNFELITTSNGDVELTFETVDKRGASTGSYAPVCDSSSAVLSCDLNLNYTRTAVTHL